MSVHKDNKYSVNSRLNSIESQLLELRSLIKSTLLVPGPPGPQGQTGASGADGRHGNHGKDGANGKDSCVPGPQGATGRQGERGVRGEKGERGEVGPAGRDGNDGQSIKGDKGDKGERGDLLVVGETELAKEVIKLRIELKRRHAAFLAALVDRIETLKKPEHQNHTYRIMRSTLESILKDIEALTGQL